MRPEDGAGEDVAEDERLVQTARKEGENRRYDDAEADRGQQVHDAPQYSIAIRAMRIRAGLRVCVSGADDRWRGEGHGLEVVAVQEHHRRRQDQDRQDQAIAALALDDIGDIERPRAKAMEELSDEDDDLFPVNESTVTLTVARVWPGANVSLPATAV